MLSKARVGQFLACSKIGGDDSLKFIHIPDLYTIGFTGKEFKKAIENNILEYVETLPKDVFDMCVLNSNDKNPLDFPNNIPNELAKDLDSPDEKDYIDGDEKTH